MEKDKFAEFASSIDEGGYQESTWEEYEKFADRRGRSFAYSKALAYESFGDWKFRSEGQSVHTLTDEELESYARTIAYKVANNLKHGYEMDPTMDPLDYGD